MTQHKGYENIFDLSQGWSGFGTIKFNPIYFEVRGIEGKVCVVNHLDERYDNMVKELWKPVEVEVANVRRSRRLGALKVAAMPLAFIGGIYVLRGIFSGHWNVADLPSYFHDLVFGGNGTQSALSVNMGGLAATPEYIPHVTEQVPEIPVPEPHQGHILSIVNDNGQNCGLLHDAAAAGPDGTVADVDMSPDVWNALKADGNPFAIVAADPDNHKHIDFSGMVNPNCVVVTVPNEG